MPRSEDERWGGHGGVGGSIFREGEGGRFYVRVMQRVEEEG